MKFALCMFGLAAQVIVALLDYQEQLIAEILDLKRQLAETHADTERLLQDCPKCHGKGFIWTQPPPSYQVACQACTWLRCALDAARKRQADAPAGQKPKDSNDDDR